MELLKERFYRKNRIDFVNVELSFMTALFILGIY